MSKFGSAIVCLLITVAGANADERFLVPVTGSGVEGAHGSLWTTELAIRNAGPAVIRIWPALFACEIPECLPYAPISNTEGVFRTLLYDRETDPPGLILVADQTEGLFMNLRARDESRTDSSMGVEIPVVPEAEFSTSAEALLNIPGDARFRHTLRIYELGINPSRFRIRLFAENGNIVSEQIVSLTVGDEALYEPSGAQVDFRQLTPELDQRYYAVVEPLDGSAFWTFISVTNNETQEVTIITPR